jgi:hypothetical protein
MKVYLVWVMRFILTFSLLCFTTTLFSQTYVRQDNESVEAFMDRYKPDSSELAHPVIETLSLDSSKNIIIAFFKKKHFIIKKMSTYTDYSSYSYLIGYLFIPSSDKSYERKLIDTIPPDGGDPEIIAVFFANADKKEDKELVVLCQYEQVHYDYGGAFYETYIYDYSPKKIKYLVKLSESFFGCECNWRNGKKQKAKFKTAADIKNRLQKLGFKQ